VAGESKTRRRESARTAPIGERAATVAHWRSAQPGSTAMMAGARSRLKAAFSAQRSAISFRLPFDLLLGHPDEHQVLGHKDCGHVDAYDGGAPTSTNPRPHAVQKVAALASRTVLDGHFAMIGQQEAMRELRRVIDSHP
jgi:hypothetical protein